MIDWLMTGGRVVDLALACVALEAVVIWALRHRFGGGRGVAGVYANLASGAFLLLALRGALAAAGWPAIVVPLTGALVAHAVDLASRLR